MKKMPLRRAATVGMAAAGMMLLAPAPAYADYVCWTSDGIKYCYDPNDGRVPMEPDPTPVEEPAYIPTPPAASVEQPWVVPAPVAQVPVHTAPPPVAPAPAPQPAAISQPAAPAFVPPRSAEYYMPAAEDLAGTVPVPAQDASAVGVPTPDPVPAPEATMAEVPAAPASPTASSSAYAAGDSAAATVQTASRQPFTMQAFFTATAALLAAAAAALFVRPVSLSLVRLFKKR